MPGICDAGAVEVLRTPQDDGWFCLVKSEFADVGRCVDRFHLNPHPLKTEGAVLKGLAGFDGRGVAERKNTGGMPALPNRCGIFQNVIAVRDGRRQYGRDDVQQSGMESNPTLLMVRIASWVY